MRRQINVPAWMMYISTRNTEDTENPEKEKRKVPATVVEDWQNVTGITFYVFATTLEIRAMTCFLRTKIRL